MNLKFNQELAINYKSQSQIIRILSEDWVGNNIFCPSCGNKQLASFKNNSPVADFYCINCNSEFELKSKKDKLSSKIVNGAYETLISRINSRNNPHFFVLIYNSKSLEVENFLVIPNYYFTNSIIEKRKPLSSTARRAGWIGCNINLNNVPNSGKIFFVKNGDLLPKNQVRTEWEKTNFLSSKKLEAKGWLLDILKIIDKIPSNQFKLTEIYKFEDDLKSKYPNNSFIKDKIRQQLQILRDRKIIEFRGRGEYSKINNENFYS